MKLCKTICGLIITGYIEAWCSKFPEMNNKSLPTYRVRIYITSGGAFNPPNTRAQTPNMPVPPITYATSRPAHQYNVQNSNGLQDCPIGP